MMKTTNRKILLLIPLLLFFLSLSSIADEKSDGQQIFKQKCSLCHAIEKKKLGPAVKSMSRETEILRMTIAKGKNSMPSYERELSGVEINRLVKYLLAMQ